mmetsp:Transcript_20259/g.50385  ORF Transcript_20259/g.50385 Transcript_20259/m.50385 type:complete len:186 (+) Transcript_20259:82-639(+)
MSPNTAATASTSSPRRETEESFRELAEASMKFAAMDLKALKEGGPGDVQFRSQSSIEAIRRISRISDYDIEEILDYWGDTEEKDERKAELKQAVKDMYYKRRESDSDFTTLGIDDKAGHGRAVRKANKELARNAVMDEQDLQLHEGILDDELLADVYSITSTAAKREAQMKAQRLAEALNSEEES